MLGISRPSLVLIGLGVVSIACLVIGVVYYVASADGIHPVDSALDLQLNIGKRIQLCSKYKALGANSSFDLLWFEKEAIAIPRTCVNGIPLQQIPNGATISVIGRLMLASSNYSFCLDEEWYIEDLPLFKAGVRDRKTIQAVPLYIELENVQPSEINGDVTRG